MKNYNNSELYVEAISSKNYADYCERWSWIELPSTLFAEEGETFSKIDLLSVGTLYIDTIEVRQ